MKKQRILKTIISIIFIPLIAFFFIGIFTSISLGIKYVLTSLIVDVLLIMAYIKLKNKIDNINLEKSIEKQKIKEEKKKKTAEEILIDSGYIRITTNFYINHKERQILINDTLYAFSEILDARIIEDETEQKIISGIGRNYNTMRNNAWSWSK